jgi:hypothetical protein
LTCERTSPPVIDEVWRVDPDALVPAEGGG